MKLPSFRGVTPAKAAAVLAVVAGATFASVLPSSADVSAQSPSVASVRVQSPGERLARGAAVRVELSVVCQPGSYAYASVRLTQRVGPGIAGGGASAGQIDCTGGLQSVFLTVHAENHPFRQGVAIATGSISGPNGNVYDDREIQIVNPA
ncbi:hypothetical protein [Saccharothrix longispora]|uniref:hypothetical protein n=1 Tax=Saccharothrix longispora TaxID=33920 RepID=UPI0028FDBD70|nr:hypothetical protein [Saccharothrix longispora]MDU0292824.1 hypothetical protein [Saccharothrix longispora]